MLLVDDNDTALTGLATTLRRVQCTVVTAPDARVALEVLAEQPVDVLVTDDRMPGMRGCELVGVVARRYPTVARILLTGYGNYRSALMAINEGQGHR